MHQCDCKWKQSISHNILERGLISTPMHPLPQIATEVCVNPIHAATEDIQYKKPEQLYIGGWIEFVFGVERTSLNHL